MYHSWVLHKACLKVSSLTAWGCWFELRLMFCFLVMVRDIPLLVRMVIVFVWWLLGSFLHPTQLSQKGFVKKRFGEEARQGFRELHHVFLGLV